MKINNNIYLLYVYIFLISFNKLIDNNILIYIYFKIFLFNLYNNYIK